MPPKRKKASGPPRGMVRRTDGSLTRKISLYMNPDLAREFQLMCVMDNVEMSERISEIVATWIKARKRPV